MINTKRTLHKFIHKTRPLGRQQISRKKTIEYDIWKMDGNVELTFDRERRRRLLMMDQILQESLSLEKTIVLI